MELWQKLNLDKQVAPSEYVSEYINLDRVDHMRFEAMSATNSMLILEYSDDKLNVRIPIEVCLGAGKWVSWPVERKMKYFRYRFKAIEEGKPFKITFTGEAKPYYGWWGLW